MNMLNGKLIIPYKDGEGVVRAEMVTGTKEGNFYRIKSIPFYASKIALYDLIDVRERDGNVYFHRIIENSERSVIQMIMLNSQKIAQIGTDLDGFGCLWCRSRDKKLVAFDVPKLVPYQPIKEWLDQGEQQKRWVYRAACLSHE